MSIILKPSTTLSVHETGDIVLYQIGVILSRHIKNGEKVGRWGGDEFALTIRCEDTDDLKDRIRSIIEESKTIRLVVRCLKKIH